MSNAVDDNAKTDYDIKADEGVKVVSFLNCFYTNPTSLNNKMSELQVNLELEDYSYLVFIKEACFKPETDDKLGSIVKRVQFR